MTNNERVVVKNTSCPNYKGVQMLKSSKNFQGKPELT